MTHRLTAQQYLTLAAVMFTASVGDTLLSHGMKQIGTIRLHDPIELLQALLNPFVLLGTLLLVGFFASYMTALSWADLTFVMPATAFGNVITALLSRFWLHEHLSLSRCAGILLITCAVGFVANGPSRTEAGHAAHTLGAPVPGNPAGAAAEALQVSDGSQQDAVRAELALERVDEEAVR